MGAVIIGLSLFCFSSGTVRIDEEISTTADLLRTQHNKEVAKNREMFKHHVKAALFLLKQGIGFRGHDESASDVNKEETMLN